MGAVNTLLSAHDINDPYRAACVTAYRLLIGDRFDFFAMYDGGGPLDNAAVR